MKSTEKTSSRSAVHLSIKHETNMLVRRAGILEAHSSISQMKHVNIVQSKTSCS